MFSEPAESDVVGQVLEGGGSQRVGQSQRTTSLETEEDRRDMPEAHGPLQRQSMACLHARCACWGRAPPFLLVLPSLNSNTASFVGGASDQGLSQLVVLKCKHCLVTVCKHQD